MEKLKYPYKNIGTEFIWQDGEEALKDKESFWNHAIVRNHPWKRITFMCPNSHPVLAVPITLLFMYAKHTLQTINIEM